jgi:hypothetical protein
MNLNRPFTSMAPSREGEVLTVLAGAEASFNGNQVHKLKYSLILRKLL